MQEAVPSSFGLLFSTYNEALSRDWWRVSKCSERIKQVNLGGGAIGTGLSIPTLFHNGGCSGTAESYRTSVATVKIFLMPPQISTNGLRFMPRLKHMLLILKKCLPTYVFWLPILQGKNYLNTRTTGWKFNNAGKN